MVRFEPGAPRRAIVGRDLRRVIQHGHRRSLDVWQQRRPSCADEPTVHDAPGRPSIGPCVMPSGRSSCRCSPSCSCTAPGSIRLLDPPFIRYLRAGLPGGPNVLLTVRGRTSGRPRSVPVAMLQVADRRFVQAAYGEVGWVRNLRAVGRAAVTQGRHWTSWRRSNCLPMSRPCSCVMRWPRFDGPACCDASWARSHGRRSGCCATSGPHRRHARRRTWSRRVVSRSSNCARPLAR